MNGWFDRCISVCVHGLLCWGVVPHFFSVAHDNRGASEHIQACTQLNPCKPINTNAELYFPFSTFFSFSSTQDISAFVLFCTCIFFLILLVVVCLCMCGYVCVCLQSNCSSLETSEGAASGVINCHFRLSPFLPPPFLLLLLLFLNLCPETPLSPPSWLLLLQNPPPILISFRNSPFLHPTMLSVLLSWSISCTLPLVFFFYNPLPQNHPPPTSFTSFKLALPPTLPHSLTLCPFWLEQGPLTAAPELVLCFITCTRLHGLNVTITHVYTQPVRVMFPYGTFESGYPMKGQCTEVV